MGRSQEVIWRLPEDLIQFGFASSRVVMMNEAHAGSLRCIRTREIGIRILPTAHESGVRHLAVEALGPRSFRDAEYANRFKKIPEKQGGYLTQPEMITFIENALEMGWILFPYEAEILEQPSDPNDIDFNNWREDQQAKNLILALEGLPDDAKLLVWCGNGHLYKTSSSDWDPMGHRFVQQSSINPFVIDQIPSVAFPQNSIHAAHLVQTYRTELEGRGGTAGFLRTEGPKEFLRWHRADAFLLSIENSLE